MKTIIKLLMCVVSCLLAPPTSAEELVRSSALIETIPIQGITLAMTPRTAFEFLRSNGYQAGNITEFQDWQSDGIEFVRGDARTPAGEYRLTFSRNGQQLINISGTSHRLKGKRFDPGAELASVRQHFGISGDTPGCAENKHKMAVCRVQDAEQPENVDLVFGTTIQPTMRSGYATRKKSLSVAR